MTLIFKPSFLKNLFGSYFTTSDNLDLFTNIFTDGYGENFQNDFFSIGREIKELQVTHQKVIKKYESLLNGLIDEEFDAFFYGNSQIPKEISLDDGKKFYFKGSKIPFFNKEKFLKSLDNFEIDEDKSKNGFIYLISNFNSVLYNDPTLVVEINTSILLFQIINLKGYYNFILFYE